MISDEKQYEYVGSVVIDRLNRSRDGFKMYLQVFSAIVGGSIWLSMQPVSGAARENYVVVSDALVILLTFVTSCMVFGAARGWWNYRMTLSKFDGGQYPIPSPSLRALEAEAAMLASMVVASVVFVCFNPFSIPTI